MSLDYDKNRKLILVKELLPEAYRPIWTMPMLFISNKWLKKSNSNKVKKRLIAYKKKIPNGKKIDEHYQDLLLINFAKNWFLSKTVTNFKMINFSSSKQKHFKHPILILNVYVYLLPKPIIAYPHALQIWMTSYSLSSWYWMYVLIYCLN